jgi:hypothetical protein
VQQILHVDTAGVDAMAGRWDASARELDEIMTPAGLGFWYQASATAVNAAQADVAAFTGGLAARVGVRAAHVAEADSRYVANEADSANLLAAVAHPVTFV